MWGQTDYSGTYYIGNYNNNGYNVETPADNYYLVPAADPKQSHQIDAYYSANFGSEDGDPNQPFLTTYKTNKDANSVWIIEASEESGFYYIKHYQTGWYVIYEPVFSDGDSRRKSMHLKETNTPGDEAKFEITVSKTGCAIRPKLVEKGSGNNCYFNVASANTNAYYSNGPTSGSATYYNGLVGLFSDSGDKNGVWCFEKAKCKTPEITFDNVTSKVTITSDDDETIYYTTTDGSNPDANFAEYSEPFVLTEGKVIKAISKKDGLIDSEIATLTVNKLAMPTITFNEETREVAITTTAEGVEIYYTTNDTAPTIEESTAHAASPVVIAHALPSTKIHAKAVKSGSINSDIATKTDIPAKVLTNPTIILAEDEFVYDGSAKEPAITVKDGDVVVSADEYVVTYSSNTNAGTASVTVSDKAGGDYQVNGSKTFTISPKSIGDGNTAADGIIIEMTSEGDLSSVKDGETTLVLDTDYTYTTETVDENKVVTITGKGNYQNSAKGIYANPPFIKPEGESPAAAVYTALTDLANPTGIKPYIIRKVNPSIGTMVISELDYIPEGVPVLLLSDEVAEGFVAAPKDPSTPEVTDGTKNSNQLKVSAGGETVQAAQIYMFYQGEFVLTKAGTLGEGKYFLYNPNYNAQAQTAGGNSGSASSRGSLQIVFDDETTGISELNNSKIEEKETDVWYTLEGQRIIGKPSKGGIYIRKGQKIFLKRN